MEFSSGLLLWHVCSSADSWILSKRQSKISFGITNIEMNKCFLNHQGDKCVGLDTMRQNNCVFYFFVLLLFIFKSKWNWVKTCQGLVHLTAVFKFLWKYKCFHARYFPWHGYIMCFRCHLPAFVSYAPNSLHIALDCLFVPNETYANPAHLQ